ncbi:TrkA-N domain protein [Halorhabdus utahensis DSM 12940]|uniref:TrkA-N domain protein n=1 Tax=Halorhabdus utahensis (strain DSM 12940 / JCM 11049 / AX-2) TaxID=519442 RepID=C7NMS2_HALUD|nr:Trk system potassium transporter TrkA [Halorhabdus utahensis]ACV11385.1 TrkA-N domain protein [Halorhabdus utahensis DSM 12940]
MRVIVVGAGEVGSSIAESLADEHEVVVVDVDGDRVEALTYELDVLAIEGDGAAIETLEEAGLAAAELLIAVTDDDETNIVSCGTAKTLDDVTTIARVRNTKYLDTWENAEGALGVDVMVGTNLLTARKIASMIGLPAARDVDSFADGTIQMAEFELATGSPVAGQTVAEADRFDDLTFAAILCPDDDGTCDEIVVPRGDTRLSAGDEVIVIGTDEAVTAFSHAVAPDDDYHDVLLVGGSSVGYQTARLLEGRGIRPKLIERDPERAQFLAESLPKTTVLQADATDRDFLESENIDAVDVVVTTLESDEANLLAGLFAKRLGADRAIAVVEEGSYVDLFETVGIDVAVQPREVAAEEITRFTREEHAENVAIIESDRAEVIEVEIDDESVFHDRTIQSAAADLPDGVVVGAIVRDGEFVRPRGDTVVHAGDHVVFFVETTALDETLAKI